MIERVLGITILVILVVFPCDSAAVARGCLSADCQYAERDPRVQGDRGTPPPVHHADCPNQESRYIER